MLDQSLAIGYTRTINPSTNFDARIGYLRISQNVLPLDIGTSHAATFESETQIIAALVQLSAPDLPIFQVTCTAGALAGTVRYTSDPGRALITGRCGDVGRIKGPILRGLAARAPFFHNGAAASLAQVVEFYNQRFQMGLTTQERADLVAFLKSL